MTQGWRRESKGLRNYETPLSIFVNLSFAWLVKSCVQAKRCQSNVNSSAYTEYYGRAGSKGNENDFPAGKDTKNYHTKIVVVPLSIVDLHLLVCINALRRPTSLTTGYFEAGFFHLCPLYEYCGDGNGVMHCRMQTHVYGSIISYLIVIVVYQTHHGSRLLLLVVPAVQM